MIYLATNLCECIVNMYVDSNHSTYKRYVTTLYWASISSTTVGYGDIVPYTDVEVTLMLMFRA